MKHIFIVNPFAGRKDTSKLFEELLPNIFEKKNEEYEIYITTGPNDATFEIKRRCIENESKENPEDITFYICGGDGTCFEAVNGIVGYPHARMSIIPIGSCNDFLKTFPEYDFMDIDAVVNGDERKIDVFKVNDRYALNVANIGFDAKVNYDCVRFRHKYKTVKQSYNHAIIRNVLRPLGEKVKIYDENNNIIFDKKSLLMAFGNGGYYGGGYNCAPYAVCDDGLMEMIVVKKVGLFTFMRLIKHYKLGKHLEMDRFKKLITYKRYKKVRVESDDLLCLCLDGETFHSKRIDLEIIPKALRFLFPKKRTI